MPWGCVDDPYDPAPVIDDIADPASAGDLVLPLLEIQAIVSMGRQVAAQPVLAVLPSSPTWISPQQLSALAGIGKGVPA
jgi:hypothetical protein